MKTKQKSRPGPALGRFRHHVRPALFVLLLPLGLASRPIAAQQAATQQNNALEEIVVTATKRPEAVRSISGAVSAITGAQLEELGAQSFSDYLSTVPGVVFDASIPGDSSVVIRGVSTTTFYDQGQGTTGYFIDDVPLTDPFFTVAIPDIDAFDVDNVTVLRGPQGTLFGSASLGGAINYQAAKPNLDEFQLHFQGTGESTHDGATGGSGKLMINVPFIPGVLAVRGVYDYRDDPGFINNIGTGQENSNRILTRGGRVEATWKPSDATTINAFYLQQSEDTADLGYGEPVFGPLTKNTFIAEPFAFTTVIDNLRLDQDLGFATLTATATYHEKTQSELQDATVEFEGLLPPSVAPIPAYQSGYARGKTFEVRLASPSSGRFEYLVGLFYDETRGEFDATFQAPGAAAGIDAMYGPVFGAGIGQQITSSTGVFENDISNEVGRETALFGEASYKLNDQWKLTLGGRLFNTKAEEEANNFGLFEVLGGGPANQTFDGTEKSTGFNPKASITWTANSDIMVYGLVSKGFRFGGVNTLPPLPSDPSPATYRSDSLINYEIGTRTNWLDHTLQLDATVFYIDWSNIQLREYNALGAGFEVNAGKARNMGLESTGTWRIARGLTFQTNFTYLSAELAQDYDPGAGNPVIPKGTSLPGASKWQASNVLRYQWMDVPLEPFFSLSHRYISRASANLGADYYQGDYSLVDVRVGAHVESVTVTAFVDNVADARGVTTADLFTPLPLQQYYVRPRTVGLTVDYRF
jgi:iron complex outermembrane receptor protein